METKKKTEITVGSVVRVVQVKQPFEKRFFGRTGVVVSAIKAVEWGDFFTELIEQKRFKVQIDREYHWFSENQVQLVTSEKQKVSEPPKSSPKRTIVIEITDNGADAKYVCGKEVWKTASIKRHPDDKPDDETAAVLVTEKLFGRNLRDLESAADEDFRLHSETLGWIYGAKEALDEAEKRIKKLI